MASGVKWAGLLYGVFYGTSELFIVLSNPPTGGGSRRHKDVGEIKGAD